MAASWVSSDFADDIIEVSSQQAKKVVRKSRLSSRTSRARKSSAAVLEKNENEDLWVNRYAPKTQSSVAGNKKKIQEIVAWLTNAPDKQLCQKENILLLTGPSGCGKTSAVKAVCADLKFTLQEWSSPNTDFVPLEERGDNSIPYESQTRLFESFLLRANKYPALSALEEASFSCHQVVLVEDIPNVYTRQPKEWHHVLTRFHKGSRSPLIIVYNTAGEASEKILFPDTLQRELRIKHISFNPVPKTDMKRVLQHISECECSLAIPQGFIDSLSESCAGDIRAAINTMEFTFDSNSKLSTQANQASASSRKRKTSKKNCAVENAILKDNTMVLFRALGKVLYCKREENQSSCELLLPSFMKHHVRRDMSFNPEQVFEKARISSHFYTLCLHQNYPVFMPNLQNACRASDYLAQSDVLSDVFTSRQVRGQADVSVSVAARGLMHSNSQISTIKLGWMPLRKPEWFNVVKQSRVSAESARWSSHTTQPIDILYSEVVPYYKQLGVLSPLCDVIPPFKQFSQTWTRSDQLDERDTRILSEEDEPEIKVSLTSKSPLTIEEMPPDDDVQFDIEPV